MFPEVQLNLPARDKFFSKGIGRALIIAQPRLTVEDNVNYYLVYYPIRPNVTQAAQLQFAPFRDALRRAPLLIQVSGAVRCVV